MYTTKKSNGKADLFPQIDRMLNDMFKTSFADHSEHKAQFRPAANIVEHRDRFEIQLAVPGFQKSELTINIEKYVLSISADEQKTDEGDFRMKEFSFGKFERKFKLPNTVDLETVNAEMKDGILTVTIGKRKEAIDNGPKEISIK